VGKFIYLIFCRKSIVLSENVFLRVFLYSGIKNFSSISKWQRCKRHRTLHGPSVLSNCQDVGKNSLSCQIALKRRVTTLKMLGIAWQVCVCLSPSVIRVLLLQRAVLWSLFHLIHMREEYFQFDSTKHSRLSSGTNEDPTKLRFATLARVYTITRQLLSTLMHSIQLSSTLNCYKFWWEMMRVFTIRMQ
jgi:hypothetical protein